MPDFPKLDVVDDDETLYRSVRPRESHFNDDGTLTLSPEAFNDRAKQVSVYRKHLCGNPPYSNPPRLGYDQAVISAKAADVRRLSPILHQPDGKPISEYVINIAPEPADHPAHAVIGTFPPSESAVFKKLKLRLRTVFTTWDIEPSRGVRIV